MNCSTPTIPGTAIYGGCECPVEGSGGNCGSDWFESCRNPLWAIDHPGDCGLITIAGLEIVPKNQSVARGRSGMVKVVAEFSDGRFADVTGESVIGSSDATISRHLGGGVITGDQIGTSFLTATWRGRLATGTVEVFDNACVETVPWDVVVVADDASVALLTSRTIVRGITVPALRRLSTGVDYAQSIFSFVLSLDLLDNGLFVPGVGWDANAVNPIGIGGSTRAGNDRIWDGHAWTNRTCPSPNVYAPGGVGARIMKAFEIFASGRPEARKILVLFSTGGDTDCNPGYRAAAQVLALNGIDVAVVTPLRSSDSVISPCDYPLPAVEALRGSASRACLFFDGEGGGLAGGAAITGKLMRLACEGCIGSSGSGVGVWMV